MIELEQIKQHLRITHDQEDDYLLSLLEVALEYVKNYLRCDELETPLPSPIKHAILLLIGHYYENREATIDKRYEVVELPMAVASLLAPYRRELY